MEAILKDLFTADNTPKHHAFLLAGEAQVKAKEVREELISHWRIPASEVTERVFNKLLVDDSRALKHLLGAPLTGAHRYVIVGFNDFTPDAAQALLKMLEEPAPGFVFIIIAREPLLLPPTLISRVWLVAQEGGLEAVKFFSLAPSERLKAIAKALDQVEEEGDSAKNYVLNVVSSVEQELTKLAKSHLADPCLVQIKEMLGESREALAGVRLSPKLVLERLALGLPRL